MAKQRIVNTFFWNDDYVIDLKADEKLLFLYVLTNPQTDLCGAYQIALKRMVWDTNLTAARILKILDKFEAAGKVCYRGGWMMIKNFTRHQSSSSEKVAIGIRRSLNNCPDWVKEMLEIGFDRVSKGVAPELLLLPEPEPSVVCSAGHPNEAEIEFVGEVLDGIRTRQKLNVIRDEAGWSDTAIFARTNNFSPTQVFDCYDLLKQQKWRRGPVTANVVATNLENLDNLKLEIKEQANGNSSKKTNTGRKRDSGDSEQSTKDFLASIGASPAL